MADLPERLQAITGSTREEQAAELEILEEFAALHAKTYDFSSPVSAFLGGSRSAGDAAPRARRRLETV